MFSGGGGVLSGLASGDAGAVTIESWAVEMSIGEAGCVLTSGFLLGEAGGVVPVLVAEVKALLFSLFLFLPTFANVWSSVPEESMTTFLPPLADTSSVRPGCFALVNLPPFPLLTFFS